MLHLLKLEWKKIRRYRVFQLLAGLYIIALPTLFLVGKKFDGLPKEIISTDSFYMFPNVWQYLAYAGSWLIFFLIGFMAVLSVTNEYQNKTLRQNIIAGLSRTEFMNSKILFIVTISLLATLYYVLVGFFFGITHSPAIYAAKIFQEAAMIPRFFLMCLGYASFGLLIGMLVKRTGLALFLYLAYIMVIEMIFRYTVHQNIFGHRSSLFYPMNAFEDLTPPPFDKRMEMVTDGMNLEMFLSPTEAIITSIVYIGLFMFLSHFIIKKVSL